jgi:hypothetical protein
MHYLQKVAMTAFMSSAVSNLQLSDLCLRCSASSVLDTIPKSPYFFQNFVTPDTWSVARPPLFKIKGGGGDVPKKHWRIAEVFCCFPDPFTEYKYRV